VVTGVLVGAGTFYSITSSILATTVVTTLAVALAVTLPRRGHGTRR
jgi:hypothetical protein